MSPADSTDTRIGRLEGRFDAMIESLDRLHRDNKIFEERQSEILEKLSKLTTERNLVIGVVTAISSGLGASATWLLTHWSKA